jgi:Spy/CpxP family protein refolding chaperone
MTMDETSKSKWRVRVAALVVFVLGFTAGALALNVYRRVSPPRFDGSRRERFEQMLNRLQLNEEQKTQVHQILSDTRNQLQALRQETEPRFDEIRRQADERLQKVLTPEQWKQFQQEREEMRRRGPRGRGGR